MRTSSVRDSGLMGRRRFLGRAMALTAAAGSGLGSGGVAGEFENPNGLVVQPDLTSPQAAAIVPIVDTHQHLWDLTKFRLPWLERAPRLARNFLMSDYLKATEGLNVVKSVYMEVAVEPSQQTAEAEYVIDLCRQGGSPLVGAVISGRPNSEGFEAYIARFHGSPFVKGLRQVLHVAETPAGYCLDPRFIRGIRLLGKLGLSFDICLRASDLGDAVKLADACPDTSFVLDHCGNASVRAKDLGPWKADIEQISRRKNTVCKVSGIVASAAPGPWTPDDLAPIVNHVLDSFGPDRVVFGGDWPVCTQAATYREWVEALKAIVHNRSEIDQRKLFSENALKVYRLG
jgi:predicted TIM-barrel fold metal-dependent hydrolase